jgi:hypothetical protein
MSGQAERYGTEVPLHDWAARPNLLCLRLLAASSIHLTPENPRVED